MTNFTIHTSSDRNTTFEHCITVELPFKRVLQCLWEDLTEHAEDTMWEYLSTLEEDVDDEDVFTDAIKEALGGFANSPAGKSWAEEQRDYADDEDGELEVFETDLYVRCG